MTTQTFRAHSVTSALQEVQRKLGPDAIVLSVRHVTNGAAWQFKRTPEVEILAIPPAPRPPRPAPAFQFESLEDDVLVHPAGRKPGRGGNPAETAPASEPQSRPPVQAPPSSPVVMRLVEQLQSQGVAQTTLAALQSRCTASLSQAALQDETRLKKFFMAQLQAEVRVRPESAALADRVICLAGASGAGKTSLCAKLAAYHSQVLERSVVWICADTFKAGAIAEAQTYASALGITLEVAYTPQELQAAVERNQAADLLLVDTQSCNPHQEKSVVELGDYLSVLPARSTILTLPATQKDADLRQTLAALRPFNLTGLAFTCLDETGAYGNVYNLAQESRLPVLYFSVGKRVVDDLLPAQSELLVSAVFSERVFH